MRIHLAALAAAALFVLAAPRPGSEQALLQGIPLGDLVRPAPPGTTSVAPTQTAPAPTQTAPAPTQTAPAPTQTAQFTPPSSSSSNPTPMGTTSSPIRIDLDAARQLVRGADARHAVDLGRRRRHARVEPVEPGAAVDDAEHVDRWRRAVDDRRPRHRPQQLDRGRHSVDDGNERHAVAQSAAPPSTITLPGSGR